MSSDSDDVLPVSPSAKVGVWTLRTGRQAYIFSNALVGIGALAFIALLALHYFFRWPDVSKAALMFFTTAPLVTLMGLFGFSVQRQSRALRNRLGAGVPRDIRVIVDLSLRSTDKACHALLKKYLVTELWMSLLGGIWAAWACFGIIYFIR